MKINMILLDMDGVLVDWIGGVAKMLGTTTKEIFSRWPVGEYAIGTALEKMYSWHEGTGDRTLWDRIDLIGERFWYELEVLPGWDHIYETACKAVGHNNVYLCSDPSRSPIAVKGKMIWMHKCLGVDFDRYMFSAHKQLLAKPGVLLVDDCDDNVKAFVEEGGSAFLVPSIWNCCYPKFGTWTYLDTIKEIERMVMQCN